MFTCGPAFFYYLQQVAPPPPDEILDQVTIEESIGGWLHPTNQYNVPYLVNGDYFGYPGRILFHPGPSLERPLARWVNIVQGGTFTFNVNLIPDGQAVPNQADIVYNGSVIATATSGAPIVGLSLNIDLYEAVEFVLAGPHFFGGGDFIEVSITDPNGNTQTMYDKFVANNGSPTAEWQYFYRSNINYPNGAINSAGPMIKNVV